MSGSVPTEVKLIDFCEFEQLTNLECVPENISITSKYSVLKMSSINLRGSAIRKTSCVYIVSAFPQMPKYVCYLILVTSLSDLL